MKQISFKQNIGESKKSPRDACASKHIIVPSLEKKLPWDNANYILCSTGHMIKLFLFIDIV